MSIIDTLKAGPGGNYNEAVRAILNHLMDEHGISGDLTVEQLAVLGHLSVADDDSRLISDVDFQTTEHTLYFGDSRSLSTGGGELFTTNEVTGEVSSFVEYSMGDHSTADGQTVSEPRFKKYGAYEEKLLGAETNALPAVVYTRTATPTENTASYGTTFRAAEDYTGDLHYSIQVDGKTTQHRHYPVVITSGDVITQFWKAPTVSLAGIELTISLTKDDDTDFMVYADADDSSKPWVTSNSRPWEYKEVATKSYVNDTLTAGAEEIEIHLNPDPITADNQVVNGLQVISGNHTNSTNQAWKAFNNELVNQGSRSTSNAWQQNGGEEVTPADPAFFTMQFDNLTKITKYKISLSWPTAPYAPSSWKFQGGDGTSWVDIDIQTGNSWQLEVEQEFVIASPEYFTHYRYVLETSTFHTITEMNLYGIPGNAESANLDVKWVKIIGPMPATDGGFSNIPHNLDGSSSIVHVSVLMELGVNDLLPPNSKGIISGFEYEVIMDQVSVSIRGVPGNSGGMAPYSCRILLGYIK